MRERIAGVGPSGRKARSRARPQRYAGHQRAPRSCRWRLTNGPNRSRAAARPSERKSADPMRQLGSKLVAMRRGVGAGLGAHHSAVLVALLLHLFVKVGEWERHHVRLPWQEGGLGARVRAVTLTAWGLRGARGQKASAPAFPRARSRRLSRCRCQLPSRPATPVRSTPRVALAGAICPRRDHRWRRRRHLEVRDRRGGVVPLFVLLRLLEGLAHLVVRNHPVAVGIGAREHVPGASGRDGAGCAPWPWRRPARL